MSDFSFLCTFVPGSEKSTDGTFVPVELSFCGTFAPWYFRSCIELSFLISKRAKNFRSLELSFLWNFRSFRTNSKFLIGSNRLTKIGQASYFGFHHSKQSVVCGYINSGIVVETIWVGSIRHLCITCGEHLEQCICSTAPYLPRR